MIDLVRRGQSSVYGQVSDVVIKGRTATNIVANGNFANGVTGWTSMSASMSVADGVATITATAQYGRIRKATPIPRIITGRKYYYFAEVKADSNQIQLNPVSVYHSGSNQFELLTAIYNPSSDLIDSEFAFVIRDARTSGWTPFSVRKVGIIDLTATFGVGNEPDKATCDKMFPYYFDGTKSTNCVRLVSVGKNLFDGTFKKDTYIDVNGAFLTQVGTRTTNKIEVTSGKQYAISGGNRTTIRIEDIYGNKIFNEQSSDVPRTIIIPQNGKYLYVYYSSDGTHSNLQIEQSLTSTPYEPYTESTLYLPNVGELRSLPNGVKDEINVTSGVKTQRNNGVIIIESDIRAINTMVSENYEVVSLKKPIDFVYHNSTAGKADGYVLEGFIPIISGFAVGTIFSHWNAASFGVCVPKGTTLEQAKEQLAGLSLTYQLAEPVVTQLDPQPLTIFPNGTQYIEFGTKEVAEYADGINISNAEIPIKAMKTVDKLHIEDGHWKRTAIDLANVAVSPDGLSFTIADAVNGETYEYSYDYDSALSTLPDLDVGEPSLVTRNNRTIVL